MTKTRCELPRFMLHDRLVNFDLRSIALAANAYKAPGTCHELIYHTSSHRFEVNLNLSGVDTAVLDPDYSN
jgi:hypothetical protein